ncbi:hypothetical protein CWI36_0662p0020 [Hamiltosporidium magnivora]|uniref:Uncharacterized protein n=1 Tax=Hamiltosporidium magnivora TaxID=148818 RepID=A0A4Q9LCT5_9MICR|nr:hypothetical protein CWI36_0662p0020 [Hamiltosporidium magnivora]
MLKDEDVKKISESKTNEIVRARSLEIGDTKKQSRVDTERYRDARNEENRIHLAKNKQSTMAHMELIQKYNTIHRSREMYRNVSDTRRAFITRTNSRRSKTDETIKHFRELRNERRDQADTDNVFDELEDMDNEISSELIKNAGENYIKELTHLFRENEKKRKCLKNGIQTLTIPTRGLFFTTVEDFVYLLSRIDVNNSRFKKLKEELAMKKPVLMYESESWVVIETDEQRLTVFEKKIFQRIYGFKEENDTAGKTSAKNETESHVFQILNHIPVGKRKVGRPKTRCIDQIEKTALLLGVEDWWNVALESDQWATLLRKAKTRAGL